MSRSSYVGALWMSIFSMLVVPAVEGSTRRLRGTTIPVETTPGSDWPLSTQLTLIILISGAVVLFFGACALGLAIAYGKCGSCCNLRKEDATPTYNDTTAAAQVRANAAAAAAVAAANAAANAAPNAAAGSVGLTHVQKLSNGPPSAPTDNSRTDSRRETNARRKSMPERKRTAITKADSLPEAAGLFESMAEIQHSMRLGRRGSQARPSRTSAEAKDPETAASSTKPKKKRSTKLKRITLEPELGSNITESSVRISGAESKRKKKKRRTTGTSRLSESTAVSSGLTAGRASVLAGNAMSSSIAF